jgi:hypothetical protein
MHPITFEGVNTSLAKPTDMTDEQCSPLPAEKNVDNGGFDYFLTAWMPNKEDLEALNAGKPLFLKVIGLGHPPVALFTVNDDGTGNF